MEQKLAWDFLKNIEYKLVGKIIVKSFINSLRWESGNKERFKIYREYLPVFPEKMQVEMA